MTDGAPGAFFTSRSRVLPVFAAAFILRLLHFASSSENPLLYSPVLDEAYYIGLGRAIADGYLPGERGLFFMDPLYGYVLGALFFVFGDNLTIVRVFQIALDSLNAVLVFLIGRRVWSDTAGLAGAILYAVYKVSFFYTLLILKTTLSITGLLVFTYAMIAAPKCKNPAAWAGLGVLTAALVYLHANLLLLAPLALFFHLVIEKPAAREFFKNAAALAIAVILGLSIGAARNYHVSGQVVFLNTQSGRLLYASNNPENLTGRYNVPSFSRPNPEDSERDFHAEAERRAGRPLTAKEVSKYWTRQALSFLANNPGAAVTLVFNKLKGTVGNFEIPTNHSFYLASRFSAMTSFPLPTFALALALGAPGLAIGFARRRETLWLLVPILTVLITVTIFYTSSRFRIPAVPFLLVGAGITIDSLIKFFRDKTPGKAALIVFSAAAIFAVSMTIPGPKGTGNEEFFLAKAYWRQNNLGKAWETAAEAAKEYPGQARFQTLMGMAALSAGKLDEAARRFLKAIEIEPGAAGAYHNLGLAYLSAGRPDEAARAFDKAAGIDRRPETIFALGRAHEAMGDAGRAARFYGELSKTLKPGDPLLERVNERLAALGGL